MLQMLHASHQTIVNATRSVRRIQQAEEENYQFFLTKRAF